MMTAVSAAAVALHARPSWQCLVLAHAQGIEAAKRRQGAATLAWRARRRCGFAQKVGAI